MSKFFEETERCPKCMTELCHIVIKNEDVFGCPKCKREISRDEAIITKDRNWT